MGKPSKAQVCAYEVAGELFETLRKGETPIHEAMRQAAAVLRVHRRFDLLAQKRRRLLPEWTVELVDFIARMHGMLGSDLQKPARIAARFRVRTLAIHLVRNVGLTVPSYPELAQHFGLDHSSLVGAARRFEKRLKTDDVLAARVVQWQRDALVHVQAHLATPPQVAVVTFAKLKQAGGARDGLAAASTR